MQITCPSCNAASEHPDLVTRGTLTKQVADKDTALAEAQARIADLTARATAAARVSDELTLARNGITDPVLARRTLAAYKSDVEELGDKAPSLADWVKGDGASFVTPFRTATPVAATQAPPATPATPAKVDEPAAQTARPAPPNTSVGTVAAQVTPARMTAAQYTAAVNPLLEQRRTAPPAQRAAIDAQIADLKKQAAS